MIIYLIENFKKGDIDTVASFDSLYEDLEFPDIIKRGLPALDLKYFYTL